IVERAQHSCPLQFLELGQFLIGARRAATIGNVQPRERAYAVDAFRISLRLVVGGLEVTPRLNLLAEKFLVVRRVEIFRDESSRSVYEANLAIVEGQPAAGLHNSHEEGREVAEAGDLLPETFDRTPQPDNAPLGDGQGIGNGLQNRIAVILRERIAYAAGHDPRGVNPFPAKALDNLLAKLAQADAVLRELRVLLQYAEDIALSRVGVHAQQNVGRGQVEQGEGMRLHNLRKPEDASQFVGSRWNFHRQQRIASLGRSDQ